MDCTRRRYIRAHEASWYITTHAIAQWCARFRGDADPDLHRRDVLHELIAISREAVDSGATTADGKAVWRHAAWPTVRFIVGAPNALVTVLDDDCDYRAKSNASIRGNARRTKMRRDRRYDGDDDT